PKAACTKIRTLLILLNRGYDDPELAEFLQTVKPAPYYHWEFGVTDNRVDLSNRELSALFQERDYFKFTFVRNPYSRIVSAYINKMLDNPLRQNIHFTYVAKRIKAQVNYQSSGLIANLLDRIITQANNLIIKSRKSDSVIKPQNYRNYIATNNIYEYPQIETRIKAAYGKKLPGSWLERVLEQIKMLLRGCPKIESIDLNENRVTFADFVRYICQQDVAAMEVQWRPYTLLTGNDFVDYDFIGKVETFDQDISYLFDKIGAPDYIYYHIESKLNTTQKKNCQNFWTDTLANMVYEKYQSDFENFGYEKFSYKQNECVKK
ncbi:MAG: sulfotransferase family protein, partial [Symploca sp. SIO3E6]|nr:sulfotransferase family protein [Caldora sp. SIO3E6]